MGFETFLPPLGPAYGHSGSLPDYAALALQIPARELSIALMTNDEAGETGFFDPAMVLGSGACGGLGKMPLT